MQFNINFKAPFFVSQWVSNSMIDHKIKGVILNVSSQASKLYLEQHAVYSATKAALDNITKNMACELGPYGIRVNCINPTVVMTEMGKSYWSEPAKAEKMMGRIPLKQFAEVEDVVSAATFLLSEDSRMITGLRMPIDGGAWAT